MNHNPNDPLDLTAQGYRKWPYIMPHSYVWTKRLADNPAVDENAPDTVRRCTLMVTEKDLWTEFLYTEEQRLPRYFHEISVQVDHRDGHSVRQVWWGIPDIYAELPAIEKKAVAWWKQEVR